ncbi:MAG: hypothetical protein AB7G15_17370, partial [Alphaproteobacteria bacterium]
MTDPRALVVWTHRWHCFVAIRDNGYWLTVDGRKGIPAANIVAAEPFELAEFYRGNGYAVIEAPLPRLGGRNLTPFMPATCVAMCKRFLGVRAWWVQTPSQLYRHLRRSHDQVRRQSV